MNPGDDLTAFDEKNFMVLSDRDLMDVSNYNCFDTGLRHDLHKFDVGGFRTMCNREE